uniref:Uncharacterized protein n=1 Tax=Romanomermis culicivorax TaxID=13658 RepID=A0A915L2W4_ROMCU
YKDRSTDCDGKADRNTGYPEKLVSSPCNSSNNKSWKIKGRRSLQKKRNAMAVPTVAFAEHIFLMLFFVQIQIKTISHMGKYIT